MHDFSRRELVAFLAALGIAGPHAARGQADALAFAKPRAFTFEGLIADAQDRAKEPYLLEAARGADVLAQIDYDQHNKIAYRTDKAIGLSGGKARLALF